MNEAPSRPRRRALRVSLAILLVLAAAVLLRAAVRGTRTEQERTDAAGLASGEVESRLIERDGRPWVQLASVIDAPIAHVWKVVHDHERMTEFMPRMAKLKVLSQEGDHRKVQIDFSFAWLHRDTQIDVDRVVTPTQRIEEWKRFGGSIPTNHGRWLLVPLDAGRTFARYEVDVDSGLPFPGWLERATLRDALPVVLTRVKERIDQLHAREPSYLDTAQ